MRGIGLFCLILLGACGNHSSSGPSTVLPKEERQVASDNPEAENNGENCIDGYCYSSSVGNGGIELLETVLDAKVDIDGEKITFQEDEIGVSEDGLETCKMEVKTGEEYEYEVKNNKLFLRISSRVHQFEKLTQATNRLEGTWVWNGLLGKNQVILTLSVMDHGRVILRKSCETSG